jgi:hypothetical protein
VPSYRLAAKAVKPKPCLWLLFFVRQGNAKPDMRMKLGENG